MFGFSLPKLLVLIGIVALVWYGFKVFTRGRELKDPEKGANPPDAYAKQPVDLQECKICGDYVDTAGPSCGKNNCPFPRGG